MADLTTSLLMSIYHKVDGSALGQCLQSIINQTRLPDQIVIVKDGPLTSELDQQLTRFESGINGKSVLTIVALDKNQGLITALNAGLKHCSGDWIIRMDADDIALPNRIEVQLGWLETHPEIDLLGSAMLEFTHDPDHPERLKPVIEEHDEIIAGLPYRNPVNHPTVCIRKRLLADGYPQLALLEDYFLWCKLARQGARFHNLKEPLYLFRFDDQTLVRRAGQQNFKNEIYLRWWMYQEGMMNAATLCLVSMLQVALRFAPLPVRRWLWRKSRSSVE